jgi:beta-glucosidase
MTISGDVAARTENPSGNTTFFDAVGAVRAGSDPDQLAAHLYDQLLPAERLGLLDGDQPFWPGLAEMMQEGYNFTPYVMGSVPRLGIPGVRFVDGPRGAVVGASTAFPVSMARGATWDVALEERVGLAIGEELRAQGGNFFGGVCVNLPRHPAWGRVQETYSDQPPLLGEMGAALTRGIQRHAMACVKHFALNSMEQARFSVDVTVDEATLHETYLPHFKRVLDEGAFSVMSSYNSVNGTWAGQNPQLLTEILRDQWGFTGTVMSDFIWGLRDPSASLEAGLDIEAPFAQQRAAQLLGAIASGTTSWDAVRRSGLRILATQVRFYAQREVLEPEPDTVTSTAHIALAREVAARSMVLLRNEPVDGTPVLPLNPQTLRTLAVLGRLSDVANTGDNGSSDVRAPYVVTALAGLTSALPGVDVRHSAAGPAEAAALAAASDVAVVVVGYTAADEGEFVDGSVFSRPELLALYPEPATTADRTHREALYASAGGGVSVVGSGSSGGDRRDLRLKRADVELIRAVSAANPRTVVVVVAAGAVVMSEWNKDVAGLVMMWYSGMEGGNGLADVLLGRVNPSGHLPYAIPASELDTAALDIDAREITYDRWFGQRLLDRDAKKPSYPLGFGLSYSTFSIDRVEVEAGDADAALLRIGVTNTGAVDGRHVVQVYGTLTEGDRSGQRELLGFTVADVAAGEAVSLDVSVSLEPLKRWSITTKSFGALTGSVILEAASYSGDPLAVSDQIRF